MGRLAAIVPVIVVSTVLTAQQQAPAFDVDARVEPVPVGGPNALLVAPD